ncbi:hypothetical protein R1sor_027563 [Riccia sorocarpa]|uniref:Uncharacterized protein n=1 Tax=Riccia sorocarpa TaxID=122646 RepID=A0ABD3GHQ5_9MARC
MLRTCSQLLRRRILMFWSIFFPLSERSTVNIKGSCTHSMRPSTRKNPLLMEHFCNPAYLVQYRADWQAFSSSLLTVLQTFEAQPLRSVMKMKVATSGKTEKEGQRESLREEVKHMKSEVRKLLEITPPKGKESISVLSISLRGKETVYVGVFEVYCWKGLRFAARQDLEGVSRVAKSGIEVVVPLN